MKLSWLDKIRGMMASTGKSYGECARILGSRGGRVRAAKRRREMWKQGKMTEARGV